MKKINSDERILIAYVLDHAQTKVGRGENSGLTLEETNLVSQLTSATNTLEGESFIYVTNTINLRNSHIVIFIQNHSSLQIRDAIKIPITLKE